MKKKGKAISFILTTALVLTTICIPVPVSAAQTDSLNASKVTITNNADETKDVIYITSGTKSGDVIRVYNEGKEVFKSTAAKGASFRFEIPSGILNDMANGTISLTVTGLGKEPSLPTDVGYVAAPRSLPALATNIVVTNNVNSNAVYDRVNVTGLRSGDIFFVYYEDPGDPLTGLAPIAKSSAATTKGQAEAILRTELPASGSIWITVKSTGRTEGPAVAVSINGVDTTRDPIIATATNNFGANDTIMITGLYPGDQVQAMEESTGVVYGSGKVAQKKTDIEISAKANRTGLVPSGGSIMIQVTTIGKSTITTGPFIYLGELTTSPVAVAAQSEFIGNMTSCGSVTIYNYENKMDTIEIRDLLPGDKILITDNPADPQKAITLKTGTVSAKSTVYKTTLKLPTIVEGTSTGRILIYVTSVGKNISEPVEVEYYLSNQSQIPADLTTDPAISTTDVAIRTVTNSALSYGDLIWITGVESGDKIMVYALPAAPTSGPKETTLNGKNSGTVPTGKNEIIVFAEFPNKTEGGSVYISYIKPGLQESERVEVKYLAETQTTIAGINLSAMNLPGEKDKLTIEGVPKDVMVQAYTTTGANYVKTAIKGSNVKIRNEAQPTVVTFAFPQIAIDAPAGSGVIYIGITYPNQSESALIPVYYDPEPLQEWKTDQLQIQPVNVFGSSDYVVFSQFIDPLNPAASADMVGDNGPQTSSNLYPGHTLITPKTVITLYATTDPAIKTKIGSFTIPSQSTLLPATGGFTVERTINAKSLNPAGGIMAYTLTYPGKAESARVEVPFPAELQTSISAIGAVAVINNINTGAMPDYVNISTGGIVTASSIIKVYSTPSITSTAIAKFTVTSKMTAESSISILLSGKSALIPTGGSVWITVQEVGKSESELFEVVYDAEMGNQTPSISAVAPTGGIQAVAINNDGASVKDFIFVFGLMPEDTVTLSYRVSATAKLSTHTAKVAASQSTATFNIYIPDAAWIGTDGTGYITVTRKGMSESAPIYLKDM